MAVSHVLSASSEIKAAISQIVVDGRFVNEFATNAQHVGNKLNLALSNEAQTTLANMYGTASSKTLEFLQHQTTSLPQAFFVVAIVIVLVFIPSCRTNLKGLVSDPNEDGKC